MDQIQVINLQGLLRMLCYIIHECFIEWAVMCVLVCKGVSNVCGIFCFPFYQQL